MKIGVVGTGISGLTLALRLQQLGIPVRLYADQTAEELRRTNLPNTVVRFPPTLARERRLNVDYWTLPECTMECFALRIGGDHPLSIDGTFTGVQQAVDFRVLLPRFMETFQERGGEIEVLRAPTKDDVARVGGRYDLVVVAIGRGGMRDLFPRDPSRSPYDGPQRRLLAGLYAGMDLPNSSMTYTISPAAGEVLHIPMMSSQGALSALLIEGIPGGPIAAALESMSTDDLRSLASAVRLIVERHAPTIGACLRPDFSPLGPRDLLAGALTPIVRKAWASLPDGRLAIAIGDAWITNDPLTGQGANIASHCAWTLAAAIAAGGPFDEAFATGVEDEMWAYAGPATNFTNAFLQPPRDHLLALLVAASNDRRVADRVVGFFHYPVEAWALVSDPKATMAFVEGEAAP